MCQKVKTPAFQEPCVLSFERAQGQKAALRAGQRGILAAAIV